jgi:hypothetical protein
MSRERPPPPAPECLERPYPSSQKGGTLIAEDVRTLGAHEQRVCDPDGYRPARCPRCQHDHLHVHDYPVRVLRADEERSWIGIVRYACAGCSAIWRILPLLLARHLWRAWRVVERVVEPAPETAPLPIRPPPVPARTRRRWRQRILAAALVLTQGLATSGRETLRTIAGAVGLEATHGELVAAHAAQAASAPGLRLAELAALVHRLVPGLRLM